MTHSSGIAAILFGLLVAALFTMGCFTSGSPEPKNLPQDRLDRIIGSLNSSGPEWILIEPVGDHSVGEVFTIHATTSLPPGEMVLVRTWPVSFARPDRYAINNGSSQEVFIRRGGEGNNEISHTIDGAGFRKTTYILLIENTSGAVSAATWYNVT